MVNKVTKAYESLLSAWNSILKLGLRLPFSKVDKVRYLRHLFRKKVENETQMERILSDKPSSVLPMSRIEEITTHEIRKHAFWVTFISFLCALPPDGWLMWLLIVVDFIQFQIFVFVILQKMLYIYGCRDLFMAEDASDKNKSMDLMMLIVSVVMIGKSQMVRMAKSAFGLAVKQVIQRFAVRLLTRMAVLNILRQLGKWFGIVLTKEMVVSGLSLIVPLVCALISGLISLWLFMPMVKKLHHHLQELSEEGKDPVETVMRECGVSAD